MKFPGQMVNATTTYQRLSVTGIPQIGNNNGSNSTLEFYTGYGSGGFVWVKNVKIEVGNKATDWTPAIEDFKSLAYQDVVELAKLGSTVVEGGYIKTSLLDANYIKSNIINAQYITALDIVATTIAAQSGTIAGFVIQNDRIKGDPGGSGSMGSSYGFLEILSGTDPKITLKNKYITYPGGSTLTTFGVELNGFGATVGELVTQRGVYFNNLQSIASASGYKAVYWNPNTNEIVRMQ
jgi:hypothetical protein